MKTRVHYTDPQGRPSHKDVVGGKDEARGIFEHLYPGVRVGRLEVLGGRKVREDATASLPFDAPAPAAPVTAERPPVDFAGLRAHLRALPEPVSRRGYAAPSIEMRHR